MKKEEHFHSSELLLVIKTILKMSSRPLHVQTPLIHSSKLTQVFGKGPVYLKLENIQPSGSFKIRGMGATCQGPKLQNFFAIIGVTYGGGVLPIYRVRTHSHYLCWIATKHHIFVTSLGEPTRYEASVLGNLMQLVYAILPKISIGSSPSILGDPGNKIFLGNPVLSAYVPIELAQLGAGSPLEPI